ncbi:caspase Dronc-like isoform X2 [Lucilia sericata]|nr:caspase Dronc-like isoform X2 [Lucilia sericata]XP_037821485.1 caspase Dronc-like isoform X2 [Lucilia sericata]XP_037821486.1 caspase Dronc-like isoform X2 [Lucilia sericata]
MEPSQRKRITRNIDSLVNLTDFDQLCRACYSNQLLSNTMIQNIYNYEPENYTEYTDDEDTIKRKRHKRLFLKITKRGPEAFEKLRQIFIALKYKDALNILFGADEDMISIRSSKITGTATLANDVDDNEENIEDHNNRDNVGLNRQISLSRTNNDNNTDLHEYKGLIQPRKPIFVQPATSITIDPKIGTYPMESKNKRGIFFMVKSDEQQSELDEDDHSLLSLFQQLDFKLYAYSNITLNKFHELLEQLLCSDAINGVECFVLSLRSGGRIIDGEQRITFNDGSVVKVEEIQQHFYSQQCKQLVGKPKIFIYPYSEISNRTLSHTNRIQTDSIGQQVHLKHVSQLSDVINCYATTKGFMDQRDNENYTRYIENFVDVMAAHACDTHFENMLKKIQTNVAVLSVSRGQYLQMSSYDNISFNKVLYFNPGIHVN